MLLSCQKVILLDNRIMHNSSPIPRGMAESWLR
jgi:hypothetical protein